MPKSSLAILMDWPSSTREGLLAWGFRNWPNQSMKFWSVPPGFRGGCEKAIEESLAVGGVAYGHQIHLGTARFNYARVDEFDRQGFVASPVPCLER